MRDRFSKWRQKDANKEMAYIDSAELLRSYLDGVESLETLKTELGHASSKQFKDLDAPGQRSLGAVVFAKFRLEELRDELPTSAGEKHKPLSDILSQLTEKFKDIYEKPTILKDNNGGGITQLIVAMQSLIKLDDSVFVDKQYKEKLFLTVYALLRLVNTTLSSIANAEFPSRDYVKKRIVFNVITPQTISEISELLETIERRVKTFDPKPVQKIEADAKPEKVFESHFNARYLKILNGTGKTSEKLDTLQKDMTQVSKGLVDLSRSRKEKAQIVQKIEAVEALLQAAKKNDEAVYGRAYFLDFINTHQAEYRLFLDSLKDEQRAAFVAKVDQLSQAVKSRAGLYALSVLSAPGTWAFRQFTPQGLQDRVVGVMPATLDSECKSEFRKLAAGCLSALKGKLEQQQVQTAEVLNQLFGEENPLGQQLLQEPDKTLDDLQQSTDKALAAVNSYSNTLTTVTENAKFLSTCTTQAATLEKFVSLNNTFLVKLSNFFAQISSIFKTDSARMVDKAKACKAWVDQQRQKYQVAVTRGIQEIEAATDVAKEVKDQLKGQFDLVVNAVKPVQVVDPKEKIQVNLLITRLETGVVDSEEGYEGGSPKP